MVMQSSERGVPGGQLSRYDRIAFTVLVTVTLLAVGWEISRIAGNTRKPSKAVETLRHEVVDADAPSAAADVAAVSVH